MKNSMTRVFMPHSKNVNLIYFGKRLLRHVCMFMNRLKCSRDKYREITAETVWYDLDFIELLACWQLACQLQPQNHCIIFHIHFNSYIYTIQFERLKLGAGDSGAPIEILFNH